MSRQCPKGCNVGSTITHTQTISWSVVRYRKCRKCGHNWKTAELEMMSPNDDMRAILLRISVSIERLRQEINQNGAHPKPVETTAGSLVHS